MRSFRTQHSTSTSGSNWRVPPPRGFRLAALLYGLPYFGSSSLSSVRGFYSSRGLPPADPAGIRPPFFIKYVFIVEFSYTRGERQPGRPDVFPGRDCVQLRVRFPVAQGFKADVLDVLRVPGRSDVFPDRDRVRLHVHCCLALFCCWLPSQHVRAWPGGALFSGWLD